ncbi:hypothetical protein Vretifemale_15272, partial [Volvox reticuliferus]
SAPAATADAPSPSTGVASMASAEASSPVLDEQRLGPVTAAAPAPLPPLSSVAIRSSSLRARRQMPAPGRGTALSIQYRITRPWLLSSPTWIFRRTLQGVRLAAAGLTVSEDTGVVAICHIAHQRDNRFLKDYSLAGRWREDVIELELLVPGGRGEA